MVGAARRLWREAALHRGFAGSLEHIKPHPCDREMGQSRETPEFLRSLQKVEAHRAGTQHSVDAVAQRALYNAMGEQWRTAKVPAKGRRGHQNLRATEEPTGGEENPGASVFHTGCRLPRLSR